MSTTFDAEYSIPNSLLLNYENWLLAPSIEEEAIFYVGIFETEGAKLKSLSMGEMINSGIDPFEDMSELYDLEEE